MKILTNVLLLSILSVADPGVIVVSHRGHVMCWARGGTTTLTIRVANIQYELQPKCGDHSFDLGEHVNVDIIDKKHLRINGDKYTVHKIHKVTTP